MAETNTISKFSGYLPDGRRKLDTAKALRLRLHNGLSYNEIAQQCDVTKGAVIKGLRPIISLLRNPNAKDAYAASRADLLAAAEMHLVGQMITPAKLKSASVNNLAYAAKQVYDMGRVEKGQSTEIIDVGVWDMELAEIRKQKEILLSGSNDGQ